MDGVDAQRQDGGVELRCRFCHRVATLSAAGFEALIEAVNAFLRKHRHSGG